MRKKISKLILLTMIFGLTTPIMADAAEEGESAGFSVQKITPDGKEVNPSSSFYDLQVTPGQELTIQAELANHSAASSRIMQAAYASSTNDNGEIDYSNPLREADQDESLVIPFSTIATLKEDSPVVLKPGERKTITMDIQVPDDAADGVILGSWYFEKENDQPEQEESNSGIAIENHFAYALAIKLTVNREIASPNLNFLGATPELRNQVIKAQIQNDQPAVVSNLSLQGTVTRKGEEEILSSSQIDNRIMAPNSNFFVSFPLEDQEWTAGDYTLRVDATTTDDKWSDQSWTWAEDFSITTQQISELSEAQNNDGKAPSNQSFLIGAAVVLVILAGVGIYLYKKADKKEGE